MINEDNLLKVNLPLTELEFLAGNGEGVWVEVDSETMKIIEDDKKLGDVCIGRMRNDSVYYPALSFDTEIRFILRGSNRPVAVYYGFLDQLDKITIQEKMNIINKISKLVCGKCGATADADFKENSNVVCTTTLSRILPQKDITDETE